MTRRGRQARLMHWCAALALVLAVAVLFTSALLPAMAARVSRTLAAVLTASAFGGVLAVVAHEAEAVAAGGVLKSRVAWIPTLGIDLALRLDGLSFTFALLVLGIGLLVVLYAAYYMPATDPLGRFFALLIVFAAAMLGLVLSDNLLMLVVFWEMTSMTSFLLIAYRGDDPDARRGALTALTVTGAGGLALLGGVLLLRVITGTFDVDGVLASGEQIRAHALYGPTLVLIVLGACTKSAQIPLHFWLPRAMAAPTPVSAYLHSATLVKAGIFLLARLHPALAGTELWVALLCGVGLVTLVGGAYLALHQDDLKGLLAYSTISHLGLIVLLLGFGTATASIAAVFHTLNHGMFKAALFMGAGIIEHETGTRDIRVLNGLYRKMPKTTLLATISAGAMAGVPFLNGFLSKEMFFAEAVSTELPGVTRWLVPAAATLAGVFGVTYSLRFVRDAFFRGDGTGMPKEPHEPAVWMRVPVELLTFFCIVVGIFPAAVDGPLVAMAARDVVGRALPPYDIALWHGFTLPLLMSGVALVFGAVFYALFPRIRALHDRAPTLRASAIFDVALEAFTRAGRAITAALERASLPGYVAVVLAAALALTIGPAFAVGRLDLARVEVPTLPSFALGAVAAVAAILVALRAHERVTAIVLLSVVGSVLALAFVRLSAPDLALTQLLVEIVSMILMLFAVYHLPARERPAADRGWRAFSVVLSATVGLGAAALTWSLLARPSPEGISAFFLREALPSGEGHNAVNVILVDFRGFDTLGEVAVLGAAGLGVAAMLHGLSPASLPADAARPRALDHVPVILATVSRMLLPLALLMSAFLFLRGHDRPGGGFVAALMTAIAIVLQYLASGNAWTSARIRRDSQPVIGVALLIMLGVGVLAMLSGRYFLTMSTRLRVPLVGELALPGVLVFEVGVYLGVVGTTIVILARLGALSRSDAAADASYAKESDPWRP